MARNAGVEAGRTTRGAAKANGAKRGKAGKLRMVSRSTVSGRYVVAGTAARHPGTTVTESSGRNGTAQVRSAVTGRYLPPQPSSLRSAPAAGGRRPRRPDVVETASRHDAPRPVPADLDRVLVKVRQVWAGSAAETWMTSSNARLGGNRPIDVLAVDGPGPVLRALDAGAWGGAA